MKFIRTVGHLFVGQVLKLEKAISTFLFMLHTVEYMQFTDCSMLPLSTGPGHVFCLDPQEFATRLLLPQQLYEFFAFAHSW
jgi:hypothetical protein